MIRRFWTNSRAAAAIEYGFIAGLISLLILAGVSSIGTNLKAHFFAPVASNLT